MLEKALKKLTGPTFRPTERSVTVRLRSEFIVLNGVWDWNMQTDAVYCSDVMFFPENFTGTKGIVHPDDLHQLTNDLKLIEDKQTIDVSFRIITTYGQIKTISGKNIWSDHLAEEVARLFSGKEPWEEVFHQLAAKKENDFLQLRSALTEITERLHGIGSYLLAKATSQVWYSDNVFRIYKLAPQSLNPYPHIFNSFIYGDDKDAVLDAFEKAFRDELPIEIEYRISLPNDEIKFVQHITRWLFDRNGHLICCGIIRDVTQERCIAQELLKAQANTSLHQQLLKFSEQQSNIAYWHINLLTRKTFYSDNYWRIFGMKPSNLLNLQGFLSLVHVDDRATVKTLFDKMYTDYVMPEAVFRIVRPDGKIRFLKQSGRFLVDPHKEPVMIGVVQDITLQRELEMKINELNKNISINKFIAETAESFYGVSSIIRHEDGMMQVSDGFWRMAGIKPTINEEMLKQIGKIIYPDDQDLWKQIVDALSKHRLPENVTVRFISKSGIKSIKISFTQLSHEKEIIVGLLQDVTEEVSLQGRFTELKLFSDHLLDSVNDIIVFTNSDHTIIDWNGKAEKKTTIKKEDALNQNLFDVLPALNEEQFISQLKLVLSGQEICSVQTDKGYFSKPHQYSLLPLKDENGNVIGVLHVLKDISRQLQLQSQLHERLNFIESLVDFSVDRIVVLDNEMNYLYWNQKAEQHYGIEKEKVIGKNILEVFPAFRNGPGYQEFRKALKGETVFLPAKFVEANNEYAEMYLTPIKDEHENVTAVLWIVHDLSNEFELQKQKQIAIERESQLKESQHWLEQTAQASPDAITIYDLEKKQPVYLNNCLADWLKISSTELVQMEMEGRLQLIDPDDRLKVLHFNEIVASSKDGDISTIEYRVRIAADQLLWIRNRSKVFQRDETGKVTHILSILQDVTEEIALREELRRRTQLAETILHASTNRITVFDRNYRFITWNKRCEEIHGLPSDKVIGKSIFEMFPGVENHPVFMNAQEQSLKGEYIHVPSVQDTYTGAYLELFYVPLKNEWGETYAVLNIMHDVSNYIKQTEALDALNKELESKNEELEQKNEEITHFSFVASHDMKEPLRKIYTFSDWLLNQEATHLSPKGKNLVEKISASVKRMDLLIEDILVLTKIHSDRHQEQTIDLNNVLQKVMEDLSDQISQTQTEISTEHLPEVKGNDNQLFYLFKNLISNAIKFQKPGNVPQIEIRAEAVPGSELKGHENIERYLKLSFTDNGFGFDSRYAKKIFKVFQRLHAKHEFEGTGIGLAICKKIMENHGGMITVESEEEKGSMFICYFPLL